MGALRSFIKCYPRVTKTSTATHNPGVTALLSIMLLSWSLYIIFEIDSSRHMYNISSTKDRRWPQPSMKYLIVHKTTVSYNRKVILKFVSRSTCQFPISSSEWQNTFHQIVAILRKINLKIRRDDLLKILVSTNCKVEYNV